VFLNNELERFIVITAVVLWFAHGWYLNTRLDRLHAKLDQLLEQFNGLREYLYEIDPQFDDERASDRRLADEEGVSGSFAVGADMDLLNRKKAEGRRTLNTRFDE
jgi:hypothetical protein